MLGVRQLERGDPHLGNRDPVEVLHQPPEMVVDLVDGQAQIDVPIGNVGAQCGQRCIVQFNPKVRLRVVQP